MLFGADQERDLRPGTENVPAIVGLGVAARLARERLPATSTHLGTRAASMPIAARTPLPGSVRSPVGDLMAARRSPRFAGAVVRVGKADVKQEEPGS